MLKENYENYVIDIFMLNFYCVNDNQEVNVEKTQIMCCIFCYNGLVNVSNSRT
jgi:hypothetical protein